MIIKEHHPWNLEYEKAVELQNKLSRRIVLKDNFGAVNKVAGVDVKHIRQKNELIGVVLIFSYPDLKLIEAKTSQLVTNYPYIPGLLSFREGPVVEKIFKKIENVPDLVFFDGHGYSHPRRLGLASHIGLILDLPSIGCAKKMLCGDYNEPLSSRGSYTYLIEEGEVIGAALRTKDNTRPIFVSVGHKVSLTSAIELTLSVSKFRVPEPTRLAHNYLEENF